MRRKSYINLAKILRSSPVAQVATKTPEKDVDSFVEISDTETHEKDVSSLVKEQEEEDEKKFNKTFKQLKKMSQSLSNDDLEVLLSSKDNFVIDCMLDQIPMIKKLQREQDNIEREVNNLANFNYAREPEFVRDRMKLRENLDEVASLRRRVTNKHLYPILDKLNKVQNQISSDARKYEEESERMALDFLEGNKNYDEFIEQYIKIRKESSQKRILADKLAKEKDKLAENVHRQCEQNSPIPTPRQRKRVSFNK